MRTSDTIGKISAALLEAQKAITFASKDATNPHFRSTYADLPAVIDAIKAPLNDAGIVFVQAASPSDSGTLALTTRLIHVSGEWLEDTAIIPLPKSDPQGFGSAMTYARRYSLAGWTGLYQDDDDGNAASLPAKQEPTTPRSVPPDEPPMAPGPVRTPPPQTPPPSRPGVHANVQRVQQSFGGRVMGDPSRAVSEKQIAKVHAMLNARRIADADYRAFLTGQFRKKHTEELTNAEVSDVFSWIESYRA